ncbi:hypothetical protein Ancab_000593 [Ancistrocladus abbreviatus]
MEYDRELPRYGAPEAEIAPMPPPYFFTFSAFTPTCSPYSCRLSSHFSNPKPIRPIKPHAVRQPAWVSLQGRLIGVEEASSARTIGGGLSREQAVSWELFSPIHRILIVVVVAVAVANSKRDRKIYQLRKCAELKDNSSVKVVSGDEMFKYKALLSNGAEQEERRMSDLSDWASSVTSIADIQLNNLAMEQDICNLKRGCEEKDAAIKELSAFIHSKDVAASKRIEELEDITRRKNMIITKLRKDIAVLEHKVVQLTRVKRPSFSGMSSENKELHATRDNPLFYMDCTTSPSSSDLDNSSGKRKKTSTIMCEESCTSQDISVHFKLTSEPSSHRNRKSATSKISTSLMSQSEQHPTSRTPTTLMSEESCTSQDTSVHSKLTSEPLSHRNRKSATSKISTSLVSQSEQRPTSHTPTPMEKSMNQKSDRASSRLKQLLAGGDIRKGRRRVQDGLKDVAPSRRWV